MFLQSVVGSKGVTELRMCLHSVVRGTSTNCNRIPSQQDGISVLWSRTRGPYLPDLTGTR